MAGNNSEEEERDGVRRRRRRYGAEEDEGRKEAALGKLLGRLTSVHDGRQRQQQQETLVQTLQDLLAFASLPGGKGKPGARGEGRGAWGFRAFICGETFVLCVLVSPSLRCQVIPRQEAPRAFAAGAGLVREPRQRATGKAAGEWSLAGGQEEEPSVNQQGPKGRARAVMLGETSGAEPGSGGSTQEIALQLLAGQCANHRDTHQVAQGLL